jgi:hypothetical protein
MSRSQNCDVAPVRLFAQKNSALIERNSILFFENLLKRPKLH